MSKDKNKLTEERITNIAAKVGAETAISKYEAERMKELSDTKDHRLRNTKLLLSHYREFKAHAESAIYSAEQSEDVLDVLDLMWERNRRSEQVVNSIKKSAVHTKIIMTHIDSMLEIYKAFAERSRKSANIRQYQVLCERYIDNVQLTVEEIAEKHSVDPRTVYLDIDAGIDRLSKLIFGVDLLSSK